jgi:macrodomain Ter protein organizer (MatP/YcbG family)
VSEHSDWKAIAMVKRSKLGIQIEAGLREAILHRKARRKLLEADDAPELTDDWFEAAEMKMGTSQIQKTEPDCAENS